MEKIYPGHPDLTGGGETPLHSHPGGGDGPTVKSGTVTTDVNGAASVVFTTGFPDTNYAIVITAQNPGDTTICMFSNKATSGFDLKTEDDGGKVESDVVVDWVAIAYNNP